MKFSIFKLKYFILKLILNIQIITDNFDGFKSILYENDIRKYLRFFIERNRN
jgi:hypothetical protein